MKPHGGGRMATTAKNEKTTVASANTPEPIRMVVHIPMYLLASHDTPNGNEGVE